MDDLYEKCVKDALPIQHKMEENLYKIRLLDVEAKITEEKIRKRITQMVNTWKKTGKDAQKGQYEEIDELFERANHLSHEKIQLAEGTYEMVDTFIQKLDKQTSNYNSFVESAQGTPHSSAGTSKEHTAVKSASDGQQSSAARRRGTAPAASMSLQSTRKGTTGRTNAKEKGGTTKARGGTGASTSGAQLVFGKGDMPIDPNEPRYCFCQQVSFGHMVGCDNKDCLLEWFHFDCVGLTSSPKGKWYCPSCREGKDSTRRQQQKRQ